MNIVTDYWAKPIPDRHFDWSAVDDDTYDGTQGSNCPIGYGATEAEAVADLKKKMRQPAIARRVGRIVPGCPDVGMGGFRDE
jgi:hypothetical protein